MGKDVTDMKGRAFGRKDALRVPAHHDLGTGEEFLGVSCGVWTYWKHGRRDIEHFVMCV